MHMHESLHLVALDNRFNRYSPLLIVRLSILNPLTPTWCLEWKNKMALSIYLCLEPILFFSFFFSKSGPWSSSHVQHHHHGLHICSTLGLDQPISIPHLEHRASPNGFHQLSETKLGLSISPFLVIDDNLSQRYELKSIWIHVASPCIFTECKGFGQVS